MIHTDVDIHYCKALKKTGKPIVLTYKNGTVLYTNRWVRTYYDHEGNEWRFIIKFNNSKGKAKRSGATTVLQVKKVG